MKQLLICIDPGHPAIDNAGAIQGEIREADINLAVAIQLGDRLEAAGYTVIYTRRWHINVSLRERVNISNFAHCDVFISLHCNSFSSPGVHGLEIFTSPGETASDALATLALQSLQLLFPDSHIRADWSDGDPDKEADFFVLSKTRSAAILVEMGFLSNPKEFYWITDPDTQTAIAMALCSSVQSWAEAKKN